MSKRRQRRVIFTAGLTVLLILALAAGVYASNSRTTKNLTAIFKEIKIDFNGKILDIDEEPFIVRGKTYVPLKVVGEAFGALVDWDKKADVIHITGGSSSDLQALQTELQQKDAEIAKLKAQIEDLKVNKSGDTSGDTDASSTKSLGNLAANIKKDFAELEEVKVNDIRLSGNENEVTVNIDVNLEKFGAEWSKLSDSSISSWITDLYAKIQEYYSGGTIVTGKIKDIDSKDTLVNFDKEGSQTLDVNYKDKDYRGKRSYDVSQVENQIKGTKYTIEGIPFEASRVDYDSNKVDVSLKATGEDAKENWADADSKGIEEEIIQLSKNIANQFKSDAEVYIDTVEVKVYDKDGAALDDFEYDFERGKLD